MTILRSIGAIVAGYLVMAVIIIAATFAAGTVLAPNGGPTPAYLTVNVLMSFGAAVAGGWACARLAPRSPMVHAGILATLIAVAGFALEARPGQTGLYAIAIPLLGAAGVILGAWIEGLKRSRGQSMTAP